MTKTLVLGLMPENVEPETCVAAGPWCFAGQEDKFPDWEKRYVFAPEPLANPDNLETASQAAQTMAIDMIPQIARRLSADHNAFSEKYWLTLLAPWAINVSRQIVDRSMRCQEMIKLWGDEELIVPILPEGCEFNFRDEQDLMFSGCLGTEFNHWLFSRLLESAWPEKWRKIVLDPVKLELPPCASPTLRLVLKQCLKKLLLRLPFPPLRGMSLKQALRYSKALAHSCATEDAAVEPTQFRKPEALQKIVFTLDYVQLFLKTLPESIKKLRHALPGKKQKFSRLRIASISAWEDAAYRIKLARWQEQGGRIAYVQHGGNYGHTRICCESEFVEYSQSLFFTWGWKKHGNAKGTFLPAPYPHLSALANKWRPKTNAPLIYVGAEMAAYGYRLNACPTPLQLLTYRQDKKRFFENLSSSCREHFLYRPYFPVPGCLQDASWLLSRFPEIKECKGALLPQILQCGLLVLDHHGTTMLEALAANVPLVMFWNPCHWHLTKECGTLLKELEEVGIWHPDPVSAARKVMKIRANPLEWWDSKPVQQARQKYCGTMAWTEPALIDKLWKDILRSL